MRRRRNSGVLMETMGEGDKLRAVCTQLESGGINISTCLRVHRFNSMAPYEQFRRNLPSNIRLLPKHAPERSRINHKKLFLDLHRCHWCHGFSTFLPDTDTSVFRYIELSKWISRKNKLFEFVYSSDWNWNFHLLSFVLNDIEKIFVLFEHIHMLSLEKACWIVKNLSEYISSKHFYLRSLNWIYTFVKIADLKKCIIREGKGISPCRFFQRSFITRWYGYTKWSGSSFHSITEWKIVVVLLMLNVYPCTRICHVFTNSLYSPV